MDALSVPVSFNGIIVAVMILGGILVALTTSSRLTALVSLGVIGFGVAWIFALYSAPDVAITQVLVEALTVVLFAWAIARLPQIRRLSSQFIRICDAAVASLVGILIALLVLTALSVELGPRVSEAMTELSLPKAYGANIVNVILVDFRALDTMGEIIVLGIAAIGVWCVLQGGATPIGLAPRKESQKSAILRLAASYLIPLLVVLSLVVLYRGHNLPGGGFIGGLIAASAIILAAMAGDWYSALKRMRVSPLVLMGIGLGTALLSALPALFFGQEFMVGQWLPTLELPVLGKLKLGTPLLFDVGVYMVVVGFTVKCASALGIQQTPSSSPS